MHDYLFILIFLLILVFVIYVAARKVWCPKCKKPSCRKVEPIVIEGWQDMRYKFCGFTKKIHVVAASHTDTNAPH